MAGLTSIRKTISESGVRLSEDAAKWNDLASSVGLKSALETYMATHIAELTYVPAGAAKPKRVICTSNRRLIGVFSAVKTGEKVKAAEARDGIGIRTRDSLSVSTYNLVEGHIEKIPLKSVSVSPTSISLLDLAPDNVFNIDSALRKCLKTKKLR